MLAAIVAGLGVLTILTLRAAAAMEDPLRGRLVRLAWLSLALTALAIVMLAGLVVHFFRRRLFPPSPHAPTPYVDAWAEAGRRYTLSESESEDEANGKE